MKDQAAMIAELVLACRASLLDAVEHLDALAGVLAGGGCPHPKDRLRRVSGMGDKTRHLCLECEQEIVDEDEEAGQSG